MRIISLVPLIATLSLFLGSCAKQESEAERNAEIDRRVQQRLEAEHQAEEEQNLAQRQAELESREKALAAQENSFATMAASIPTETVSTPAEAVGPAPSADSYSAYPDPGGEIYPEQDGFVSANEPDVVENPYFFTPAAPSVTILNQNVRIVYLNRNPARAGGHGQRPPACPPGVPRGMGTGHRATGGPPKRTIDHGPTGSPGAPPVANHRPATGLLLQGSR